MFNQILIIASIAPIMFGYGFGYDCQYFTNEEKNHLNTCFI